MTLTYVDILPKNKSTRKMGKTQEIIAEFYNSNAHYAKLENLHYKTLYSAQSCIQRSVNTLTLPINVRNINGEIYLIRTDM